MPFKWNDECEEAFLDLKNWLTSAPILVALHNEGQYVLGTDVLDSALEAVLQPEQRRSVACNWLCKPGLGAS